jgi:hypothetical protein
MYCASSLFSKCSLLKLSRIFTTASLVSAVALISGCGGGGASSGSQQNSAAFTLGTLIATSTGNDLITSYRIAMNSVTLTNKAGKSVPLFTYPASGGLNAEFIHMNGDPEPFVTGLSIPQDTYVSATADIASAYGVCLGTVSGGILVAELGGGPVSASSVTVNLPQPLVIGGNNIGLLLDMQTAQSSNLVACEENSIGGVKLTPTFNLTTMPIASTPTNTSNGRFSGLRGLITSLDSTGSGFTVTAGDGPTWPVNTNGSTVFQGITSFAQLVTGIPVEMDANLQPDGSLVATRVAAYDIPASDLNLLTGPLIYANAQYNVLGQIETAEQGPLQASFMDNDLTYQNANFQVSGQLANLSSLPFTADFSATTMTNGQNVWVSSSTQQIVYPTYIAASTITLVPQTINGSVSSVTTSGNFTVYTVTLASYDLFPLLANNGSNPLTNPGVVEVYVDSNTQLLNSGGGALAAGKLARFNGLVFDDNGALRMDCAQISDGVAE